MRGVNMKVKQDDIDQVLALFDKDDIIYINIDYLLDNEIIEIDEEFEKSMESVLSLGDNND